MTRSSTPVAPAGVAVPPDGPPPAPVLALPAGRRRPALLVWGLLIVLMGGVGAWWGIQQSTTSMSVVAMASDVRYGDTIELTDLVAVDLAPDPGVTAVPWSSAGGLVGQRAATDLFAGSLLTPRSVTSGQLTTVEESVVGVTVKPSQAPTMALLPRDRVLLVVVPSSTDATVLDSPSATDKVPATVMSVGAVQPGGTRTVDVVVPNGVAAQVAVLAADGRIVVVFQGRG